MEITPKLAILETLREMDNLQAIKVLEFIKSINEKRSKSRYESDYPRFKQEALIEIRSALRKG